MWVNISIFLAQILIEGGDEEYLSYAQNSMTFGNMGQKLRPSKLPFFCKWAIRAD